MSRVGTIHGNASLALLIFRPRVLVRPAATLIHSMPMAMVFEISRGPVNLFQWNHYSIVCICANVMLCADVLLSSAMYFCT